MATSAITPDQNVVTAEIFIAAPPERVFQAITDPTQPPQWWGQQGVYRLTEYQGEVRVGGKWSSIGVGADGTSFRVDGEYLEVDPPRRLVYTWISSFMGPQKTIVHWELEPQGGSWFATSWTTEDGYRHDGENSSRRLCGSASGSGGRPLAGLGARARLDAGFCGRRRDGCDPPAGFGRVRKPAGYPKEPPCRPARSFSN